MSGSTGSEAPNSSAADAQSAPDVPHRRLIGLFLLPSCAMYALFQGIQQILIPAQAEALDPGQKVANLALLTVLSSIGAVAGLLAGGALSDRTRGRFGRRTPWLVAMALISSILLVMMGQPLGLFALAGLYMMLWFSANFYQGVLTAVLPDRIPEERRGIASSIIGLGTPLGILLGVNMAARVEIPFAYGVIALALLAATAIFVIAAPEGRYDAPRPVRRGRIEQGVIERTLSFLSHFFGSFRHRDFMLAFVSRAMLFLAYFTISGYMFYILQDHIGTKNLPGADAKVATSILATVTTGVWIVTVAAAGWLADRLDRRKLFVAFCSIGMGGTMMIPIFFPTWEAIIVFKALSGFFFGTYMAVDLALMSLVLPDRDSQGRDMAVLAVATAGPQIMSPIIAGGIITWLGYTELFLFGALMAIGGGFLTFFIRSVR